MHSSSPALEIGKSKSVESAENSYRRLHNNAICLLMFFELLFSLRLLLVLASSFFKFSRVSGAAITSSVTLMTSVTASRWVTSPHSGETRRATREKNSRHMRDLVRDDPSTGEHMIQQNEKVSKRPWNALKIIGRAWNNAKRKKD